MATHRIVPRVRGDRLNFGRFQLIRDTMVAAGDGTTPVWAVRYGWNRALNSPWATVSEADQVHYAVDALTLARTDWPWLTAMAWAIDQPAASAADPSWGFACRRHWRAPSGVAGRGDRAKTQSPQSAPLQQYKVLFHNRRLL
ncbi:MAG: hypothetical protein R2867_22080 [Caldilineaceae bacterium]